MGSADVGDTAVRPRAVNGQEALVEAAKRLLPDRAPGAISGRDLAAEADVNYGLVHHYFGGKDAAFRAGLRALRDDFVATHGDAASMSLLTGSDPYLKALVRWHIEGSDSVSVDGEFPIGAALVEAVAARMNAGADGASVEAKARAIAMISLQLCFAVFGPVLLEGTGVEGHERTDVMTALSSLYDSIALADHNRDS
jgi:AcrR family transcriptional regulator